MAKRMYVVLMGDLIESRERTDREDLQADLLGAVADLNQRLPWAAPLTVTAGDEVQGLLDAGRCDRAMQAMALLTEALLDRDAGPRAVVESPIRFGLGFGPLSTGPVSADQLRETSPAMLDGGCFHNARDAMRSARKDKRWAVARGFQLPDETLDPNEPSLHDAALNSLFGMMGALRASWTSTQARHVRLFRREQGQQVRGKLNWAERQQGVRGLRRRLSEIEGVSPSVITQSLQGSSFDVIREAEFAVEDLSLDCGLRSLEAGDVN